jgi:hypothetical protein
MIVSSLKTIRIYTAEIIKHNKQFISEKDEKFPNKFQFEDIYYWI